MFLGLHSLYTGCTLFVCLSGRTELEFLLPVSLILSHTFLSLDPSLLWQMIWYLLDKQYRLEITRRLYTVFDTIQKMYTIEGIGIHRMDYPP